MRLSPIELPLLAGCSLLLGFALHPAFLVVFVLAMAAMVISFLAWLLS